MSTGRWRYPRTLTQTVRDWFASYWPDIVFYACIGLLAAVSGCAYASAV